MKFTYGAFSDESDRRPKKSNLLEIQQNIWKINKKI